jgi:hypothetical protein
MVQRILNLNEAIQADAADALAAAMCHHHRIHRTIPARVASPAAKKLASLLEQRVRPMSTAEWAMSRRVAGARKRS